MIRKIIAPIIITMLTIGFLLLYFEMIVFLLPLPIFVNLAIGLIPLSLVGVSIYVLIDRILEVRSGEEDDLGDY